MMWTDIRWEKWERNSEIYEVSQSLMYEGRRWRVFRRKGVPDDEQTYEFCVVELRDTERMEADWSYDPYEVGFDHLGDGRIDLFTLVTAYLPFCREALPEEVT